MLKHVFGSLVELYVLTVCSVIFLLVLSGTYPASQSALDHVLPAVQSTRCGLRVHPSCLQMVQLGDPCVYRR